MSKYEARQKVLILIRTQMMRISQKMIQDNPHA